MKMLWLMIWMGMVMGKNIQVPAVQDSQEVEVRLNSLETIQPEFNFEKVVRREVFESTKKREKNFPPCQEAGPEVSFHLIDSNYFQHTNHAASLVWDFKDVMFSQYLLDIAMIGNQILVMLSDGHMKALTVNSRNEFVRGWEASIPGVTNLAIGYFVEAGSRVLFVNGDYLLEVDDEKVEVLEGYEGGDRFQSVAAINDTYIAVAFQQKGVIILDINSLQTVGELTGEAFLKSNQIQLTDIAFSPQINTLFILDQNDGIYAFSLTTSAGKLSISKAKELYKRPYCSLMYLYKDDLLVGCEDMVRISLRQWPKITEKVLAHPNIKVREIYAWDNMVAFVGRNVFKLMYLDRLVDNFEDIFMDKFVFNSRFYLSANQDGLFIGNYTLYQPSITCSTTNPKYLGEHHLVLKTKAECSDQYFEKYQIDKEALGEIEEGDYCMYVSYRKINIWQAGQILMTPILITVLVCFFLTLVMIFVWLMKKLKLKNLEGQLSDYKNVPPDSAKHQQFVEEDDPGKSAASNLEEENPRVDQQLHDIE